MQPTPLSPLPAFEQTEREAFDRLLRRIVVLRMFVAPLVFTLLFWSLVGDGAVWRRWVLGLLLLPLGAGVAWATMHFRRTGQPLEATIRLFSSPAFPGLVFPVVLALIVANGGMESPMLPFVVPVGFFAALMLSWKRSAYYNLGVLVCVWIVYALSVSEAIPDLTPAVYGGGPRAGHNDTLLFTSALALSLMLVFMQGIGSMVRSAYQSIVRTAFAARDDALKSRAESVQSLTALSGEIAHELKNPLASVKGLAAMIAREVEGRPAERLAVLRREVDRMQEILEDFLTFSRPLLPLAQEQVALGALCHRVAELHEGMAGERGVALRVFAETPVKAWCDARKVKQVLINLVQNALEVAPRGSAVELVVLSTREGGARVEVRDRGPGLSQDVVERLFEPGFTTKATGNGLGLAIARALARQHGGDVELWRRQGGGCVAELVLPPQTAATPEAQQEGVA